MKAAVLYEARKPLHVEDLDIDEPGHGQVLVKIMASGVCHSDWHIVKGEWTFLKLPAVLGHEGAGIVESAGPGVTRVRPGDHVILSWRTNCGTCEMCMKGHPVLCDGAPGGDTPSPVRKGKQSIRVMAGLGTFGSYTVVPEGAAIPMDKDVPFPQAALIGCGVMTGVGAAINTAQVQPGSTVAVFGCGGVGLNCIQGAALANASVIIAVDLLDSKLERAKKFGGTHTVNSSREDPVAKVKELTEGKGVHYAFEAVGLKGDTFLQSILCTRKRGLTVFVGHAPENTPVALDARMLIAEKVVMGSLYGSARPHIDFPRLIGLYKQGKLKLDELVTRVYPLEQINSAFDALAKGEVARSVIQFR